MTNTKKADTKKADTKKADTKKADTKKADTKKADTKKADTKKRLTFKEMTNAQFAKENDTFRTACKNAGVEPSARQASKYRQNKGIAYRFKKYQSTNLKLQVAVNLKNMGV